ncbi:MAG: HK97 gp10 family phage protein [Alphaproteobacteria bacterium]|nr:HK97 gp10 family phage protein [Alphaproteobacteria bacterium]
MINAAVVGEGALISRLGAMPRAIRERVEGAVGALAQDLRALIQRKLSGEVLQRRSGTLSGSIEVELVPQRDQVAATVATGVPYAGIHEYGGTIPAREVLPKSGRVLAFPWKGEQRFFKRVQLPQINLPERSFLRSALDEMAPEIRAALADAVREAVRE